MISGHPSALYDTMLADWRRVALPVTTQAQGRPTSATLRKTPVVETVAVVACTVCGGDLAAVDPIDRECRILHEIVFAVVERRVTAEIPGPLQYGSGLQAFVTHLLMAQMLSLNRAVALVPAITGLRLSAATCLGFIQRRHVARQPWEDAAIAPLLNRPARQAVDAISVIPRTPGVGISCVVPTASGNGPVSSSPTATAGHDG